MPWLNIFIRVVSFGASIGDALGHAAALKDLAQYVNSITTDIITYLNDFINIELWAQMYERNEWHGVLAPDANRFAGDINQAFENVDGSLRRIVFRIIPNSAGQVGGSLGRLWTRVQHDERYMQNVQAHQAGLIYNQDKIILPQIRGWEQFTKWWDKNFSGPAGYLIKWTNHPADLSGRLAPSMTPDVIGQLGIGANRGLAKRLAAILLNYANQLPSDYPASVDWLDQAAVAFLNAGNY